MSERECLSQKNYFPYPFPFLPFLLTPLGYGRIFATISRDRPLTWKEPPTCLIFAIKSATLRKLGRA